MTRKEVMKWLLEQGERELESGSDDIQVFRDPGREVIDHANYYATEEELANSYAAYMEDLLLQRYELKSCPVCGGTARVKKFLDSYWVECEEQHMRTYSGDSAIDVVNTWNRRVSDEQFKELSALWRTSDIEDMCGEFSR